MASAERLHCQGSACGRAKQALGNLVFGQEVSVDDGGKDRYGRTIRRVYLGQLDVNAEMVRTGYDA